MDQVKRFYINGRDWEQEEDPSGDLVSASDYDRLARQLEEGIKRWAELCLNLASVQQRLAEAENHLALMVEESDALRGEANDAWAYAGSTGAGTQVSSEWTAAKAFLAQACGEDVEKAE